MIAPQVVRLDEDRVKYWMSVGVQPSDTVSRLLGQANILPSVPRRVPAPKDELPDLEA